MKLSVYILLFLRIELVLGIQCYSCIGRSRKHVGDDPCANPAENVGDGHVREIDCVNEKLCWKGITGGRLKRGCGEKRCALLPDINMGSLITQTCCANDLCNRTSARLASQWLSYFLLALHTFNFLSISSCWEDA